MKAIHIDPASGGPPEVLVLGDAPDPAPGPGEILVRVEGAGVNRPDVLQRLGRYAPPEGESLVPGLEMAGEVIARGEGASRFEVGERICGLVGGGGYAELCVAPEDQCLPIPAGVTPMEAGAIPETWFTVWANVFEHGALQPGETLLVHGGSSGIGHVALQLAVARGARVITTSSQPDKRAFCERLGAELTVDYREEDFVARVLEHTEGRGADVVLDMVGGDYLPRNLEALAFRGRIVSIATLRGATAELPILKLMAKQAILTGSFLRRRSRAEKARLRQRVEDELWPLLAKGRVRPHVDRSFPLAAAADAHRVMEAGSFLGKLVLVP